MRWKIMSALEANFASKHLIPLDQSSLGLFMSHHCSIPTSKRNKEKRISSSVMHHHYSLMINKCGILNASKGLRRNYVLELCRARKSAAAVVVCANVCVCVRIQVLDYDGFQFSLRERKEERRNNDARCAFHAVEVSLSVSRKRGESVHVGGLRRQTFTGRNVIFSNFLRFHQIEEMRVALKPTHLADFSSSLLANKERN